MTSYDFSCKNFQEFCRENNVEPEEARTIVFSEIDRLLKEIKQVEEKKELMSEVETNGHKHRFHSTS